MTLWLVLGVVLLWAILCAGCVGLCMLAARGDRARPRRRPAPVREHARHLR